MPVFLKKNRELNKLFILHPTPQLHSLLDNIENDDDIEKFINCMIDCYKQYNSNPKTRKFKRFSLTSFFFPK